VGRLALALLLAAIIAPPTAAAETVVGNPGPITISLNHVKTSVGGSLLALDQPASLIVGPVAVASSGRSTWPAALLTMHLTEPVSGFITTLAPYSGTLQLEVTAESDLDVTIDPTAGTISASVALAAHATFSGTYTTTIASGAIDCSADGSIALALHASGYDPATGTAHLVDDSYAVSLSPACTVNPMPFFNIVGIVEGLIAQAAGLPAAPGASQMALDVTIAPAPRAPVGAGIRSVTIVGTPVVGHSLTCAAGGVTGLPGAVITYRWRRDGKALQATARTYPLRREDAGHRLACTATASNGVGFPAARDSPSTLVPARCVVPAVAGLTLADATTRLQRAGCSVATHVVHVGGRKGRVVRSRPAKGRRLANGARVLIDVRR
jgi:hypothetical protein